MKVARPTFVPNMITFKVYQHLKRDNYIVMEGDLTLGVEHIMQHTDNVL